MALILRNLHDNPEILFIQRAENINDPWSGQIAFPGGNRHPDDADVVETARRETAEEVGIKLQNDSLLGRLDDLQGRKNNREISLIISCLVFHLETPQRIIPSVEVGNSFWMSITDLVNPKNRIQYQTDYALEPYPGVEFSSGVVLWGLTYRFVQKFLHVIR